MSKSILVVCSEQHTLDVLNKELANSGYLIQFENDISRAAEFFEYEKTFSVALLCVLPANINSMLVLLELLRYKHPDIACIILLAVADANIISECRLKGAKAVLSPPFTKKDIIANVEDIAQVRIERKESIRILILEDDPVSKKLLANYLEPIGRCDYAADGKIAIELFQNALRRGDQYQLVLIDIMVPEIQGHDVLRIIREEEEKEGIPFEKKAKIIMTTSLSDSENIIESFKANCNSYLIKPIRKNKLYNEIRTLGFHINADGTVP